MNNSQITAVKCAYAALQGMIQADDNAAGLLDLYIDIDAAKKTIKELEDAFPFLKGTCSE